MWPFKRRPFEMILHYDEATRATLRRVENIARVILERVNEMPTKEEFDALIVEVKAKIDAKNARIAELEAQVAAGGLTAEQEQAIFDELAALKNGA